MTTFNAEHISNERFLRLPEVISRTGLSRSTIYLHIAEGQFPKQTHLGPRSIGWRESEINAWMASRIVASRNQISKPT